MTLTPYVMIGALQEKKKTKNLSKFFGVDESAVGIGSPANLDAFDSSLDPGATPESRPVESMNSHIKDRMGVTHNVDTSTSLLKLAQGGSKLISSFNNDMQWQLQVSSLASS